MLKVFDIQDIQSAIKNLNILKQQTKKVYQLKL